jgi:hypothetical protein
MHATSVAVLKKFIERYGFAETKNLKKKDIIEILEKFNIEEFFQTNGKRTLQLENSEITFPSYKIFWTQDNFIYCSLHAFYQPKYDFGAILKINLTTFEKEYIQIVDNPFYKCKFYFIKEKFYVMDKNIISLVDEKNRKLQEFFDTKLSDYRASKIRSNDDKLWFYIKNNIYSFDIESKTLKLELTSKIVIPSSLFSSEFDKVLEKVSGGFIIQEKKRLAFLTFKDQLKFLPIDMFECKICVHENLLFATCGRLTTVAETTYGDSILNLLDLVIYDLESEKIVDTLYLSKSVLYECVSIFVSGEYLYFQMNDYTMKRVQWKDDENPKKKRKIE